MAGKEWETYQCTWRRNFIFNGVYYWHGEYKIPGKAEKDTEDGGISCYTSTDLVNWNNAGVVLGVDYNNLNSDIANGCILERPKVVFNEMTRKFIAYFKLFLRGEGYTPPMSASPRRIVRWGLSLIAINSIKWMDKWDF